MMTSNSSIGRNDTTSRLLVGTASFGSALIEYKYRRMSDDYYTLARISGPWVLR